jgi:hypothetical protein
MRLAVTTLWLLAGAALTGAAYWTFLITPESTVGALAVSALLLLVSFFLLAVTLSGAILGWSRRASARLFRDAVTSVPAIVPAALVYLAWWKLTNVPYDWVRIYSGQINAWFIATLGWDEVSWFFTTMGLLDLWLKAVVGFMLGLSLMAAIVTAGWASGIRIAWLKRALAPSTLAWATVWFVVFIFLPRLYLANWRPEGLPATSLEMAFIAGKLSLTALLIAVGTSLMIRQSLWTTSTPSSEN